MNFRHVLVVIELGLDARHIFAAVRRFAPSAARAIVIARQQPERIAWFGQERSPALDEAADRAVTSLREAANGLARSVEVMFASELSVDALADTVTNAVIDLVAVGSSSVDIVGLATKLRRRRSVPVLCVGSTFRAGPADTGDRLFCVGLTASDRSAIATFLRDQARPSDRITVLWFSPLSDAELQGLRDISGVAADVRLTDGTDQLSQLLGPQARLDTDLVVLTRFPPRLLLRVPLPAPVLVLPPGQPVVEEWQLAIDLADLVDDGVLIRARLEYALGGGRRIPVSDQEFAFVAGGRLVARVISRQGEAELPSGIGSSLGLLRSAGRDVGDPLALVELNVAVLRGGPSTLILFDVELEDHELVLIRRATWAIAVGVRVRATRSCASLRARLRAAGLDARVIDARAVLGEGEAPDVPALADAVRVARTAARMRAVGFAVAAVVYRGPHAPATQGFAAVRPQDLAALAAPPPALPAPMSSAERLDLTTGSKVIEGNRVEIEFDNPTARRWLLDAINGSRERVQLQTYMAADDDVGAEVEAALAAAAARGVIVRVLADSLHGLHGSFGLRNPLLDRLASRDNIELRVVRPITGAPSLEDVKQRDHRKLLVADGRLALLGGRNISHEYYTGFGEVRLTPQVQWRMVPWMDGGARVEGPAVAVLERAFREAWTEAGGAPFEIRGNPPAGPVRARVVMHRGMRDAYTVETYVGLIDSARSHIYVVNGFPLLLEIQNALLRAVRRGIRVRLLVGNLTPKHGDEPFTGPWAVARTLATSFVHSRVDPLVAAGAECYEFAVRQQPGWDSAVIAVRPHVHAKAMSTDGAICAIGSANFDVTGGYWESELQLVVEDVAIATAVEARLEELIAGSARIDPNDAEWHRRAELRKWMRYWPGVLSG